jgi:hypothetical protein
MNEALLFNSIMRISCHKKGLDEELTDAKN